MDYTALKAEVAAYLHRSDLTTPIPDFIEKARRRIGRDVRALANLKTATVTSWTNGVGTHPTDLAKLRTVTFDNNSLVSIGTDQLMYWQSLTSPLVYAIQAGNIIVPGIGSTDTVTLEYWAVPAALSGGTDVSAGMAEWPSIWTAASVAEGALYCRDFELQGQMIQLYTAEVMAVNASCTDSLFGTAPAIITDQPMLIGEGGDYL